MKLDLHSVEKLRRITNLKLRQHICQVISIMNCFRWRHCQGRQQIVDCLFLSLFLFFSSIHSSSFVHLSTQNKGLANFMKNYIKPDLLLLLLVVACFVVAYSSIISQLLFIPVLSDGRPHPSCLSAAAFCPFLATQNCICETLQSRKLTESSCFIFVYSLLFLFFFFYCCCCCYCSCSVAVENSE